MERSAKISKLGLSALVVSAALGSFGLTQTANAATTHHRAKYNRGLTSSYGENRASEEGPYVQDRLQDGTLTGPIARDSNGGG
jgi:hypothetical protein